MTNSNRAAARRTGRAAVSGAARGSRAGDEPAWSPGPLPTSETRFERPAQRLARRARRRTGALGTGSHVTRPCNCELGAGRVYGVCGPEDKKTGTGGKCISKEYGIRAIFSPFFFFLSLTAVLAGTGINFAPVATCSALPHVAPLSLYKREDFSAIAACSSRGRNGRKPPARNAENRYEVPDVVRSGLMVLGSPLFAASQPTTAPETFAPSAASHDCPRLPTETIGTKAKTCSSTPPYPDTGYAMSATRSFPRAQLTGEVLPKGHRRRPPPRRQSSRCAVLCVEPECRRR